MITETEVEAVREEAKRVFAAKRDVEGLIGLLRERGLSKVWSIKLLKEISGMPLGAAKDAVDLSAAWSDRRIHDEEFHESVHAAFRALENQETKDESR